MLTFAEYLSYQAPPNTRDELIPGEIVLSSSLSRRHQGLCYEIQNGDIRVEGIFNGIVES